MFLSFCYYFQNPSKPHFNHYLFETFSLAIRIVCRNNKNAVLSFEEALFPVFENILQQDIQGMSVSKNFNFCVFLSCKYNFAFFNLFKPQRYAVAL